MQMTKGTTEAWFVDVSRAGALGPGRTLWLVRARELPIADKTAWQADQRKRDEGSNRFMWR